MLSFNLLPEQELPMPALHREGPQQHAACLCCTASMPRELARHKSRASPTEPMLSAAAPCRTASPPAGCCSASRSSACGRGEAFITYLPYEDAQDLKLTVGLDMSAEAPVIGRQWHTHSLTRDEPFYFDLAPARAFHTSEVSGGLQSAQSTLNTARRRGSGGPCHWQAVAHALSHRQ